MTTEQLDNIFTYHAPNEEQRQSYEMIRAFGYGLAKVIDDKCPESREKALAITNVQQAVMWANASIAINEVLV